MSDESHLAPQIRLQGRNVIYQEAQANALEHRQQCIKHHQCQQCLFGQQDVSQSAVHRCYFQLRAIGQLAAARARLDKAQQSLQRSHGPSGARMRRLHGNFCPELAMCVNSQAARWVVHAD